MTQIYVSYMKNIYPNTLLNFSVNFQDNEKMSWTNAKFL